MNDLLGWVDRHFSDFIVYVDESGDHGLVNMDQSYPVFTLAFCVFRKVDYVTEVVPDLQQLKFKYFGHDLVVLHEHEMRKQKGPFAILRDRPLRDAFLTDVTSVIERAPFVVIAAVINKAKLTRLCARPNNPYHLAMQFCLERLKYHLEGANASADLLHVLFESRGAREDQELELEFRRVCAAGTAAGALLFEPVFAKKGVNSTGLQLADLIARPIGRHVLDSSQPNRAFTTIERKFRRSTSDKIDGYGLKIFP